jgi:hypothetical protein
MSTPYWAELRRYCLGFAGATEAVVDHKLMAKKSPTNQ